MLVPPGPGGNGGGLAIKGGGSAIRNGTSGPPKSRTARLHVVVRHDADLDVVSAPLNQVGIDKGLSTRMALSDGRYVPVRTVDVCDYPPVPEDAWHGRGWDLSHVPNKRSDLATVRRREADRARDADFRLTHYLVASFSLG